MLNTITKHKIPVILVFGPTAVGKTELLLDLFKGKGEVINADSIQIYKDLDIGSAKPDSDYCKEIPHYLISQISIKENFSVAQFVNKADELIKDIYNRGLIPVISGGTPFYFKNFIYGLPELPDIDLTIREKIQGDLETKGLAYLFSELEKIDPEYSRELNSNDTYRIIRAIEIKTQTGKSIQDFKVPDTPRDIYSFLNIGLVRDRTELYSRINSRVDTMFNNGLEDEVIKLLSMGYNFNDPGFKGIGYAEFKDYFASGCWLKDNLKDEIKQNSRRYAKRQITFFNSFENVNWVNHNNIKELKKLVDVFLTNTLDYRSNPLHN